MYKQHWERYSTWYTKLDCYTVIIYEDGEVYMEREDDASPSNIFISIDDLQELLDDAKEYIEARKEYLNKKDK